jgi:hypothetical protein
VIEASSLIVANPLYVARIASTEAQEGRPCKGPSCSMLISSPSFHPFTPLSLQKAKAEEAPPSPAPVPAAAAAVPAAAEATPAAPVRSRSIVDFYTPFAGYDSS